VAPPGWTAFAFPLRDRGARDDEQDDFHYAFDFKEIYRSFEGAKSFSRKLGG
jgi:hypothetical protein